jgi:hypothetical protein
MAHLLAGSDVRYDVGDDHPLAGRLAPDLTLDGGRLVAGLLHHGRPVLLDRRCRALCATDPARRLRRLGGKLFRNRRRGPVARCAAEVVRYQRRRARRSTPGWRPIFGPSNRANSVMAATAAGEAGSARSARELLELRADMSVWALRERRPDTNRDVWQRQAGGVGQRGMGGQ